MTTITRSAWIESARAKPSEPQADGPCEPSALPKGSAVGAAMTATSTCTSPSWIACQRPPCERSTPRPRIFPREQYSPRGPFMLPSMWCTTPCSCAITGRGTGTRRRGTRPGRARRARGRAKTCAATRSPFRRWWCVESVIPSRRPARSSASLRPDALVAVGRVVGAAGEGGPALRPCGRRPRRPGTGWPAGRGRWWGRGARRVLHQAHRGAAPLDWCASDGARPRPRSAGHLRQAQRRGRRGLPRARPPSPRPPPPPPAWRPAPPIRSHDPRGPLHLPLRGANASCTARTCRGWMQATPSKPSARGLGPGLQAVRVVARRCRPTRAAAPRRRARRSPPGSWPTGPPALLPCAGRRRP